MTPNQVTAARVLAAFAAVALFTLAADTLAVDLAAVVLTVAAIALDGVDGYLARRRSLATPLGAQLDILGDRVVENLFFTFFAVSGLVSLWVPVLFFVRGTLTDFLRGLAVRAGRGGFGRNSMLETWWGRSLVASRGSRAAYATLKCVCFCSLGLLLPLRHVPGVAFGAFGAAAVPAVQDIYLQVKSLHTASTALGQQMPGLSGGFSRVADAVRPEVYVLFGEALHVINQGTGTFQALAVGAGHLLDQLSAPAAAAPPPHPPGGPRAPGNWPGGRPAGALSAGRREPGPRISWLPPLPRCCAGFSCRLCGTRRRRRARAPPHPVFRC